MAVTIGNGGRSQQQPIAAPQLNVSSFVGELSRSSDARPVFGVGVTCIACWVFLVYCVSASRSLVLTGAAWLTVFALFSLASSLVAIGIRGRQPSSSFSFGLARAPVLAVFSSTVLAQLASIFLIKESIERLLEGDEHTHAHSLFIPGTIAATMAQLLAAYAVRNDPFNHVLTAATSSWLQEHAADLSHAICYAVPGLSRFLLPRLNPLGLLAFCGSACCIITHYLVIYRGLWWADPSLALCLSFAVFGTMWPLSAYSGRIMLQTSPPHILNQLDRCVREAGTLDGVLELRQCHFWQLDFAKMAGTVEVRVRRDADEQLVLAHVTEKLSAVVQCLTVQVVKDTDQYSSWPTFAAGNQQTQQGQQQQCVDGAAADGHGHSHDHGGGHGHSHHH